MDAIVHYMVSFNERGVTVSGPILRPHRAKGCRLFDGFKDGMKLLQHGGDMQREPACLREDQINGSHLIPNTLH